MTESTEALKPKPDPNKSVDRVMNPRSLANLRPPWAPGRSPNPSGRAKDGLDARDAPVRALLRRKLAKRRELHRFVNSWIEAAINGDSTAREQILKRLDPILDDPAMGRQILTGLRLELQVGKGPVTHIRGLVAQQEGPGGELRGSSEQGLLEGGTTIQQSPAQISEVVQESQSLSEGTQVSGGTDGAAVPS